MVGREPELGTLLAAYADGQRGHTRAVLLRGEAGIGKTRLVQTFLDRIATSDAGGPPVVTAIGQCVDAGTIGAPFGPVRRVLRDLASAVGIAALREAAGSPAAAATLSAAVPALRPDTGDAAAAEVGFADALEVALESLSATRHVVIVIEDLQWADASTLTLLKSLAGTLRGHHLTIVATYRSDDVDRFHPLRPVLAELDRTREMTHVDLLPLTPEQIHDQIALLAQGGALSDALRAVVVERSGGIPFLVEELLDLGDAPLPATLRELVLARYLRLSGDTQLVVRTMAAGGMRVDDEALTAVAATGALDHALREAIDAHIVQTDDDGYAFRHALTREAVNDELLPSERVRVHRRYAEILTGRADDPDAIAAASEHWLVARDIPRAFDASITALELSRATIAPATTARILERLTELWAEVPDAATRTGGSLAALHRDAARAWVVVGEDSRALRAAEEGLAEVADEPIVHAALLQQKCVLQSNITGRAEDSALHEAATLLEGIEEPAAKALRTRILTNLALGGVQSAPPTRDPAAIADGLRRSIALAEELDDATELVVALVSEGARLAHVDEDEAAALEPLERADALAPDAGVHTWVGAWHTEVVTHLGRYDAASEVGRRYLNEATAAGLEGGNGAIVAGLVAFAEFCAGRPGEGLPLARRATRLMAPGSRPLTLKLLGTFYTWNDEPQLRDELLASEKPSLDAWYQGRGEGGTLFLTWSDASTDAVLAAAAGLGDAFADPDRAARVAKARHEMTGAWPVVTRRYGAVALSLLARAIDAGTFRVDGTGPAAAEQVDTAALWAEIDAIVDAWPPRGVFPAATAFIRAVHADAQGAPAADRVARWRETEAMIADGVMAVRQRHLARLSLAAALLQAGDRREAGEILARIVAEAPEHGVARIGRWAGELARRAGLDADTADDGAGVTGTGVAALTAREQQVLSLIADGLTNTQIGGELFISPKTVSVHVSAILAKTGAANRTEAATLYRAVTPSGDPG
ncbi:LuxR family transcriptional regulator [Microbacterium thalassium]|nr:LuxR family transcriptional regulator [Microbacterium thalassium]